MGNKGYRTFVQLDPYEKLLLERLYKHLCERARKAGKKKPTQKAVIQGCIRTAIHTVYGDDFVYTELLPADRFRELMGEVGMGPDDIRGG